MWYSRVLSDKTDVHSNEYSWRLSFFFRVSQSLFSFRIQLALIFNLLNIQIIFQFPMNLSLQNFNFQFPKFNRLSPMYSRMSQITSVVFHEGFFSGSSLLILNLRKSSDQHGWFEIKLKSVSRRDHRLTPWHRSRLFIEALPRFFPLPAGRKKKEEDQRRPIARLLVMERALGNCDQLLPGLWLILISFKRR